MATTYIDTSSKKNEDQVKQNIDDLLSSITKINEANAASNEDAIKRQQEEEEEARRKEQEKQEALIFENKYKEEQERRRAFEAEVAAEEAAKKKTKRTSFFGSFLKPAAKTEKAEKAEVKTEESSAPVNEEAKPVQKEKKKEKTVSLSPAEIKRQKEIERLAYTDTLTGLYNRNKFEEDKEEIKFPLITTVSIDADRLKQANDTYGHKAGDMLLKTISSCMKSAFSGKTSLLYRIGGDEFLVIFRGNEEETANACIESFKKTMAKKSIHVRGASAFTPSASCGVGKGSSIEEAMMLSDEEMYRDKAARHQERDAVEEIRENETESSPAISPLPVSAKPKKAMTEDDVETREGGFSGIVKSFLSSAFPTGNTKTKGKTVSKAELKRQKEIERLAYKDPLTDYDNRNKFEDDCLEATEPVTVVLIVADTYKDIYSSYGQDGADALMLGIRYCIEKTISFDRVYRLDNSVYLAVYTAEDKKRTRLETAALQGLLKEKGVPFTEDEVIHLSAATYIGRGDNLQNAYDMVSSHVDEAMEELTSKVEKDKTFHDVKKREEPKESVTHKSVAVKKKKKEKGFAPASHASVKVEGPIAVNYENIINPEGTAEFVRPESDGEYMVDPPDEESVEKAKALSELKQKSNEESIVEMVTDIEKNKDDLVMIVVASNDMESLMLLQDPDKFLEYCSSMEADIYVSYVYALYRNMGPVYYFEKPEEEILTKIFSDIGDLFIKNEQVTGPMLSKVKNIGIFKHIYI